MSYASSLRQRYAASCCARLYDDALVGNDHDYDGGSSNVLRCLILIKFIHYKAQYLHRTIPVHQSTAYNFLNLTEFISER